MLKIILFTSLLSASTNVKDVFESINHVCENKDLSKQVKCTKEMIKCLKLDSIIVEPSVLEFSKCVIELEN